MPLSYEAKMIVASNLAVAKAILSHQQSQMGGTPAVSVERRVRDMFISCCADLEGIDEDIDKQIGRNAAKKK